MKAVLHVDGGLRGKRGTIGWVLLEPDTGEVLRRHGRVIGECSSNEAEYSALISGLANARYAGVTDIEVKADSKLVIEQMRGNWAIRAKNLAPYVEEAHELLGEFDAYKLTWVPREQNAIADQLGRA